MVVFFSYYIHHLVYSGLFIEKERIKRQKIQLNRYFNNQKNGILVVRDDCELKDNSKIMLCNRALEKLTGLTNPDDEERFFNSKIFSISNNHVGKEDLNN